MANPWPCTRSSDLGAREYVPTTHEEAARAATTNHVANMKRKRWFEHSPRLSYQVVVIWLLSLYCVSLLFFVKAHVRSVMQEIDATKWSLEHGLSSLLNAYTGRRARCCCPFKIDTVLSALPAARVCLRFACKMSTVLSTWS